METLIYTDGKNYNTFKQRCYLLEIWHKRLHMWYPTNHLNLNAIHTWAVNPGHQKSVLRPPQYSAYPPWAWMQACRSYRFLISLRHIIPCIQHLLGLLVKCCSRASMSAQGPMMSHMCSIGNKFGDHAGQGNRASCRDWIVQRHK